MKNCPICGKLFDCFHSKECWCIKYVISEANKEYLALHYKDCLCENCLLKFVDLKLNSK